jgi:hypothetical protein
MELRKKIMLRNPTCETPPAAASEDRRGRLEGRIVAIPGKVTAA